MDLFQAEAAARITSVGTVSVQNEPSKLRPFELVFLLNAFDPLSREVGQTLDSTLGSIAKGLFDFLDPPPIK